MRIISVNVGEPRQVTDAAGNRVLTSIYKTRVENAVRVRVTNIDGDRQADLVKHGGGNCLASTSHGVHLVRA
jgi:MOSC domain-containing protein YiiM